MKLYLPTTIATLMLLGVPSFSTAVETKFERGRDAQKQYTDEPAVRRLLDHDSQPRLYYNNYDAVQSNINSFAATSSSSSQFDIRHAFCYTWDGQAAQPNPSWPVMHTREPQNVVSIIASICEAALDGNGDRAVTNVTSIHVLEGTSSLHLVVNCVDGRCCR